MSNRRRIRSSDPRRLRGDIAGPGGPHDHGAVVLDTTRAILMDSVHVSTVDSVRGDQSALAMLLGGRINRTQEQAHASGPRVAAEFVADLVRRMKTLETEGNL